MIDWNGMAAMCVQAALALALSLSLSLSLSVCV